MGRARAAEPPVGHGRPDIYPLRGAAFSDNDRHETGPEQVRAGFVQTLATRAWLASMNLGRAGPRGGQFLDKPAHPAGSAPRVPPVRARARAPRIMNAKTFEPSAPEPL